MACLEMPRGLRQPWLAKSSQAAPRGLGSLFLWQPPRDCRKGGKNPRPRRGGRLGVARLPIDSDASLFPLQSTSLEHEWDRVAWTPSPPRAAGAPLLGTLGLLRPGRDEPPALMEGPPPCWPRGGAILLPPGPLFPLRGGFAAERRG